MSDSHPYPSPLVWLGTWKTPAGLSFNGFHVWARSGQWVGVYNTFARATAEATWSSRERRRCNALG